MFFKSIERKFKRTLIKVLSGLSAPPKVTVDDLRNMKLNNIAVVRQDNRIGNLVFLIPLIKALHEDFSSAKIDVITGYKYGDILTRVKEIDEIICFNQKKALLNPNYFLSFRKQLKKKEYDLVIDAGNMGSLSTNNILTGALCGGKVYAGYDRKESSSFLNLLIPQIDFDQHESQLFLNIANFISGEKRTLYPRINTTKSESGEALKVLGDLGYGERVRKIGIHVGGRYGKRWELDNFLKLADELSSRGNVILLFSGPDESKLFENSNLDNKDGIIHFRSPPLGLLIGLISKCELFITGDNGPLHLAAALGIPCVQIFLVDNWKRYGYRDAPHKIVMPLEPSYEKVRSAVMESLN